MSDDGGFEEAFPSLRRDAYRTAYRILGQSDTADDAACEALARAWLHWSRIGGASYRAAWVKRVAANVALNMLRKQRRIHEPAEPPTWAGFENGVVVQLALLEAIRGLPRRQREVVALRFLADLSESEVGTVLNISTNSVKKHLQRGLTKLRVAGAESGTEVTGDACASLA